MWECEREGERTGKWESEQKVSERRECVSVRGNEGGREGRSRRVNRR